MRVFTTLLTSTGIASLMLVPALAPTLAHATGNASGSSVTPWVTPMIVLAGMIVMALIVWVGMRQLTNAQNEQMARVKQSEKNLQQREKIVLASAFSAELTENKIKCETFITIYTELLRNLRELERRASYEDTGDFIHQHPPLSRQVYDDNLDKLSYFSAKLASDLNHVYGAIRIDPQYFTLDTTMPRAAAIRIVEMVIDDAQKTLEPIDPLIAALDMIIRDGSKTRD